MTAVSDDGGDSMRSNAEGVSTDGWEDAMARLGIEDALSLGVGATFWETSGIPSAGIPALKMADGPCGVRCQPPGTEAAALNEALPATCFPSPAVMASTWDEDLAARVGRALGDEARTRGVGALLAPGVNIKRSPLCGRGFEFLSEDPLLSGRMAAAEVRGIQAAGVAACVKHLAANSQEYRRSSSDSVLDERTLREVYLAAFERVVREASPAMVMTSYNRVNGVYASDNAWLVRRVLRGEFAFDGVVVTDWGGMHDRAAAYRAGVDLAMPGPAAHLKVDARRALASGDLDAGDVWDSACRVAVLARASREAREAREGEAVDETSHHDLARAAAESGAVLLSNDGVLPLAPGTSVAIVGAAAASPRFQGSGSSHVTARAASLTSLMDARSFAEGYSMDDGSTTPELLAGVREAVAGCSVAVVVLALPETWESEGFDRASLDLPAGENEVVRTCAEVAPRTVVVLQTGGPVGLPWLSEVGAVLWCGLSGEASCEACARLLRGDEEPSGRLAETWPVSAGDVPCSGWWGSPHRQALYREGIYVGYRYYETARVRPLFPFGHGLGYSEVVWRGLVVGPSQGPASGPLDPARGIQASLSLENKGTRETSAVVQIYVTPLTAGGPYRPTRVLAGYEKARLLPGEARRVSCTVDARAFQVWQGGWRTLGGRYRIEASASVADPKLAYEIEVEGEAPRTPRGQEGTWYAAPTGLPSDDDLAWLLGHRVPPETRHGRGSYTLEDALGDLSGTSRLARVVEAVVRWRVIAQSGGDADDPQCRMSLVSAIEGALFSMVNASAGQMPEWVARAIVRIANL